MVSVAEVIVIRLKSSSRKEAGTEVHDVFPSLFCLIPLSCFLCSSALSRKRRRGNLISQHCYILFLGSKSPFSPFAVPCNLDTSAQLCYKAACRVAGYWQRYCAMKHLYAVQVSVFVLGLKCFALYTCTSHANRPCLCYRLFWWIWMTKF